MQLEPLRVQYRQVCKEKPHFLCRCLMQMTDWSQYDLIEA